MVGDGDQGLVERIDGEADRRQRCQHPEQVVRRVGHVVEIELVEVGHCRLGSRHHSVVELLEFGERARLALLVAGVGVGQRPHGGEVFEIGELLGQHRRVAHFGPSTLLDVSFA